LPSKLRETNIKAIATFTGVCCLKRSFIHLTPNGKFCRLKIRCFSGFGKRFSEIIIVIYIK